MSVTLTMQLVAFPNHITEFKQGIPGVSKLMFISCTLQYTQKRLLNDMKALDSV